MGQKSGKIRVGTWVTIRAGLNDVVFMQRRFWIGGRQDIVRPVTVRTFSGRGRSQFRGFSMIGVKISFRRFFMTFPALIRNMEPETTDIMPCNGMRVVTVIADG